MKRSLIRQFNLLIIFTVVIYVISTISLYAFIYKNVINELQEEILLSNANEISYMVDHFVQDEILMLSRFANSQKTKQWLLSIQDEENYNNMEEVLLVYSKLINVESIFIVDDKEKRYYTSTRVDNILEKPTFDHILSESNDDDLWYNNTLETTKNYDVNIGKELKSDDLCLWVNIIVSHEDEKIGVIGCSLPLESIVQDIIDESITHEDTFVCDEFGAIQLSNHKELIQTNSFHKEYETEKSIYSLVNSVAAINELSQFTTSVDRLDEIIPVNDAYINNIVVSRIPVLDWTVVTLDKGEPLTETGYIIVGMIMLIILASVMVFLLIRFTRLKLLLPIKKVEEQIRMYESKSEIGDLAISHDEIGWLSTSIIKMETSIEANRKNLELELKKKEEEVHKLYKDMSESEKNLKRLLGALPIGVVRFNDSLEIVYCNNSALNLLGVTSLMDYKKMLEKCNFFPFVSIEEKEGLSHTIYKNEVLIDYRLKLQVSSFTQLDVLMNVYKVNLDGVEYYEGIMKDITKIIKDEKQLIKRANYDNLTGVLSRAAFINHLDEFISYHFQEKAFSYFITFDFDYFKLINDKFGHLAGDQVLKSVLDTISSSIGELGVIGRIGGDEFAAIIWEIHENHIFDFLDQLRQTVAELKIDYNGELLQMTISIGYTVCNASDNFKRLYYRSDQALYEAKGLGKNTICKNNG